MLILSRHFLSIIKLGTCDDIQGIRRCSLNNSWTGMLYMEQIEGNRCETQGALILRDAGKEKEDDKTLRHFQLLLYVKYLCIQCPA